MSTLQHTQLSPVGALQERMVAAQMTGIRTAGDYRDAAEKLGYSHLVTWDTMATCGDWSFLVSADGKEWHWMFQRNNYPKPGFTYDVDPMIMEGTIDQVMAMCAEALG